MKPPASDANVFDFGVEERSMDASRVLVWSPVGGGGKDEDSKKSNTTTPNVALIGEHTKPRIHNFCNKA